MGEKLTAFIPFYSSKALEEVERIKTKLVEHEERWKKLNTEDYPAALKTATDLGQLEMFQQVFPKAGEFVNNVTKYTSLLGVDDGFKKQISDLYKNRGISIQIEVTKQRLAKAEAYAKGGGEEYLNRLAQTILQKAADISSGGANFDNVISNLFKSPGDYKEQIEELIDSIPGPDYVLDAPETYAALLEKKEAGSFTFTTKKEESTPKGSSALNESTPTGTEVTPEGSAVNPQNQATSPNKTAIASNINQGEGTSAGTTEKTTGETASVTTSSPEVSKPIVEAPSTNININLEKETPAPTTGKLESTPPGSQLNLNSSPGQASSIVQNTTESTTTSQQTINSPSSTVNQSTSNESTTNPTANTSESTTSSSTTLNQASLGERPKLKDKLKQVASSVVNSKFVENLGETARESLKVAAAQAPVLNTIIERAQDRKDRERTAAPQVNSSTSTTNNQPTVNSTTNQPTNTTVNSLETVTTNQPTTTVTQPIMESNVEKSNPTMAGNTNIIQTEKKVETPTAQPTTPTPTTPTISEVKTELTPKPQTQPNQTAQESPQVFIDVASLENRLKRIEQALSNPLEVIIKET